MKTQNFVQLVGYLAADPVIRKAGNGSKLARIRMATDSFYQDEHGTRHKKTSWHNIKAWNRLASLVPGNFIKGSHILVQGEIGYRSYTDNAGVKKIVTEITARQLLNLDR